MSFEINATQAASLLLQSRRDGTPLVAIPPGFEPTTLAEAYAVQDATLRELGGVGAWKVAGKPGAEPRCAALPARDVHTSGVTLPVPRRGCEVEVEVGFVIDRDLPDRGASYTEEDVLGAIRSAHLAIEILASRFVDRRALPPFSPIADLQSNAAVVLGPAAADWRAIDFANLRLSLRHGSELVDLAQRNDGLPATLPVLAWLANHAVARRAGLRAGDVVITGARLGPVALGAATEIIADCPGFSDVSVHFLH